MPYVKTEEEKQRPTSFFPHVPEWRVKQQARDARQDAAFNKLTQKQKDALRDMWKAYDRWDTETTDQCLLYETVLRLQTVRSSFMRAFPALTTDDDEE